jgi:hypothetical protein
VCAVRHSWGLGIGGWGLGTEKRLGKASLDWRDGALAARKERKDDVAISSPAPSPYSPVPVR